MKKGLLSLGAAALLAATTNSAQAQISGDIDVSFGTNGYALHDYEANTGEIYLDMITLSDDKIIMTGYTTGGASQDILIARLNADGSRDSSFGINGSTTIDASIGLNEQAWAVKELVSGKLLLSGIIVTPSSWDGFIMQLNADGSIDNTFGTTASGRTNFNAGDNTVALGADIEVLSDNSILVGGFVTMGGQADMSVFKFTSAGALDVSFSSSGVAMVDIDGENDEAYSMAITASEQIILAGKSDSSGVQRGAVAMLTQFGTPTSFAGSGSFTFDHGSGFNEVNDVMVDSNGKIVFVGDEGADPDINGLIYRLNSDGSLDNTFSNDGWQMSDPGLTTKMYLTRVMETSNGGVLATGFTEGQVAMEAYAILLQDNGNTNGDFNNNGMVGHGLTISTNSLVSFCGAMQSDGSVLVGGYVTSQDFVGENMFLIRLLPEGYVGIEEREMVELQLSVFPNPSTEAFSIQHDAENGLEGVELVNLSGQVVGSWKGEQSIYQLPSEVSTGQYIVQVQANGYVYATHLSVVK